MVRVDYMTQRQQRHCAESAAAYESVHIHLGDEYFVALEYVVALLHVVRAQTVLDVGSGTGRTVRFLGQRCPELQILGIQPADEFRKQAQALGTVLHNAVGENLPFHYSSFDIVMSLGLLHHIRDPEPIITEMMRVARFGVMISDANRFEQGSIASGSLKLAIHCIGLWSTFERLRSRGRGYMESAVCDPSYSYSSFDSMPNCRSCPTGYSLSRLCRRRNYPSCRSLQLTDCSLHSVSHPAPAGPDSNFRCPGEESYSDSYTISQCAKHGGHHTMDDHLIYPDHHGNCTIR